MDLNYLYRRRGESLFRAANARCEQSRDAHLAMARGYVTQIDEMRRANIAAAAA